MDGFALPHKDPVGGIDRFEMGPHQDANRPSAQQRAQHGFCVHHAPSSLEYEAKKAGPLSNVSGPALHL